MALISTNIQWTSIEVNESVFDLCEQTWLSAIFNVFKHAKCSTKSILNPSKTRKRVTQETPTHEEWRRPNRASSGNFCIIARGLTVSHRTYNNTLSIQVQPGTQATYASHIQIGNNRIICREPAWTERGWCRESWSTPPGNEL